MKRLLSISAPFVIILSYSIASYFFKDEVVDYTFSLIFIFSILNLFQNKIKGDVYVK